MCPAASTRWCPTPEQLMILEEMYRSGVRTPNAPQIQQITAHLAFYGRIEGKNVFYWFQNHKARDRQKLRKKLAKQLQQQQQQLQLQQMYRPYYIANKSHHHHFQFSCDHHMSSPSSSSPAYSSHTSAMCLPHAGIGGEEIESKVMKELCCSKGVWRGERMEEMTIIEKPITGSSYGRDWTMMMMDVGPPPPSSSSLSSSSSSLPCCGIRTPKPPLKTLELFPVSSSNFKEATKP